MLKKILKKQEHKSERIKIEDKKNDKLSNTKERKLETRNGIKAGKYRSIIKRPYLSEKAYAGDEKGKYEFLVENSANKLAIKEELSSRYNVTVKSVNIIRQKAKPKSWRGKSGKQVLKKKAIITLKPGQRIEIT